MKIPKEDFFIRFDKYLTIGWNSDEEEKVVKETGIYLGEKEIDVREVFAAQLRALHQTFSTNLDAEIRYDRETEGGK